MTNLLDTAFDRAFDRALGLSATALKLRGQRLDVIAGNIANAATPGFKARDLDADALLAQAAMTKDAGGFAGELGSQLAGASLKYRAALQPSLDGNTVEMATEQAAFAENALKYQASLGFLTSRIQTLMRAMNGGEG
jgi:flagellar basal-body rod protein FlgB